MCSMHPNGSLYERPINLATAVSEHRNFRETLQAQGVRVHTVRGLLALDTDHDMRARLELEDFAFERLTYVLSSDSKPLTAQQEHFISDDYKRDAISAMSTDQLVEIVLTKPTVTLRKADKNTEMQTVNVTFEPLGNLVFTRDQQITTAKGIVMCRLSSPQRSDETRVLEFCFHKLGITPIGHIPAPGTLEGGDFIPCGDVSFVGVGLRSNQAAIDYLMDNDLLGHGSHRLAVVRDTCDQNQDRMHLDTVFNVVSDDVCLMSDNTVGLDAAFPRFVDEYSRDPATGKYTVSREKVEHAQYMRENGFAVIPIPAKFQLAYGCNVLNLGEGRIISVHADAARLLARYFTRAAERTGRPISIQVIPFRSITSMYGSVHCASCVLRRVHKPASSEE
jgi:arginine deiminase